MSSVHSARPRGPDRQAAVLVPLLREGGEWHLLFIRRSVEVQDHKGQVAFPGGAIETEDADAIAAALRETREEIGLPESSIRVLGQMAARTTVTHYFVTPVVGVIPWPFAVRMQVSEVSRVFTIPLRWLAKPENHTRRDFVRPGGIRGMVDFFEDYDGELLWGITAAMTLEFLEIVR
ncbi:CoA pyrophosphatase [Longilinea arvoryzae]|nr:CoA pyrophosphatase [Longilinea arvoryzae]